MVTEQSFSKLIEDIKKPLNISEFKSLSSTCVIIDTRIGAETTGLIKGSYWFPDETIQWNWLPTFIHPEQPYLCICDRSDVNQVFERFILMGYMNCHGYNNFQMKHYDGEMEYPICRNWRELGDTERKQFVDVRNPSQWKKLGVPRKAILIELKNIDDENQSKLNILKEVQKNKLIVVNCKSGLRTKLATSILFRHGIFNVSLVQNIDDFPKLGIKMQAVEENKKYWDTKKYRLTQISSEEENKLEKQIQSENMNRMAVEECYEECLKKNPGRSLEKCHQQCVEKIKTKNPDETIKLEHSFNRNQFQASKQHIIPSKNMLINQYSPGESPDSQLFIKAFQNFKSRNYIEAKKQLTWMIEKDSQNPQLYFNRALCEFQLGNPKDCQDDLEKAIKIDQMSFVAYFNLASIKFKSNQANQNKFKALQILQKSMSSLYTTKYVKEKDQKDISKALSLNPDNVEALMLKGLDQREKGNVSESLRFLQRINKLLDNKNQKTLLLCDQLRQMVEKSKAKKKQENPEIQKHEKQPVNEQENKARETKIATQGIDQKVQDAIKQWNQLYSQVFGDSVQRIHAMKESTDSKNSIWIMN